MQGAQLESEEAEAQRSGPQLVSVVVPAFDEEGNLEHFHSELGAVLKAEGLAWELVFVDDGSRDGTWALIKALHERDDRVRGISFSRNFGHQRALFAGIRCSRGDVVVSMDADLQHPPHVIPELVASLAAGFDIVHTVRRNHGSEPWLKRMTSRLYYRVFSYLSSTPLENGMSDFRLLDRRVVDDVLEFREEGLFLRGIVQWVGHESCKVEFECGQRFSGRTSYTPRKMLNLAWNGITSFSMVPLRLGIVAGLLAGGLAFAGLLQAVYAKFVLGTTVSGWAQSIVITTFLFGVLFILLGLIGEYLGRILLEVRARPHYLVKDEIGIGFPKRDRGWPAPPDPGETPAP